MFNLFYVADKKFFFLSFINFNCFILTIKWLKQFSFLYEYGFFENYLILNFVFADHRP